MSVAAENAEELAYGDNEDALANPEAPKPVPLPESFVHSRAWYRARLEDSIYVLSRFRSARLRMWCA